MSRALSLALLGLAGCASVSPTPSYRGVSQLVEQRGGHAPRWDEQGPEDAAVGHRVRALLGQDLAPEGAVEVALLRNRRLLAVYQSLGVAQADLVQAGLLRNPSLGLSVGFPLAGSPRTSLAGSLTEDFLAIFTLPLRKRFAALELEQAEERVGAAVLDLNADVRAAYYRLQGAQQLAELWRTLVSAEEASAELADRQYQAGNISELDQVSRRAAYEQMRLDVVRAENSVLEAREALNRLMGVWGAQTSWKVTAPLPDLPLAEPPPEELESTALRQRLDLAAAGAESKAALEALHLAAGTRYLGTLEVGAQAERDPEGNRLAGPTLSLELPIFDQHQAQLARLEAQARAAQAREDALAAEIRSEVRSARVRLLAARSVVEHHRKVLLPLRTRIVELSQEKYDAMLLGVYGLLQAKQSEVSSYRDYLDAVREYWVSRVELERVLGGRYPRQEPPSRSP